MLEIAGYRDLIAGTLARAGDNCACVVAMADGEVVEGVPVGGGAGGICEVGGVVLIVLDIVDIMSVMQEREQYHHYPSIWKEAGSQAS